VKILVILLLIAFVSCSGIRRSSSDVFRGWFAFQEYQAKMANQPAPKKLPIPVARVQLHTIFDTWGGARSEGRKHEGVDIFAPTGTPIYSATDGIIITVGLNRLGGKTVTIWGAGDRRYYYAHLSKYANITEQQIITRGTLIGYVGNSGDASSTPPHLHFGVYDQNWKAMNPFSMLEEHGGREVP
jgi:peptidoglycan LD-endopeptidase LytH